MKLSTKGRYGLRAIVDLAIYSENETISLSSIAERENISISYLEQLIAKLKKAGLVISVRGAQGGYKLAKPTHEISVGEVLRVLEGNLDPVNCAEVVGGENNCSSSELCVTKYVWKRISDSINDAVDQIYLSELVNESKKKKAQCKHTKLEGKPTCQ